MAKASQQRGSTHTRMITSKAVATSMQLPAEGSTNPESKKELSVGHALDHTLHAPPVKPLQIDYRPQMHHQFHLRVNIPTYLDDFKQGFPKKGLATISNQWWGSEERGDLKLDNSEQEDCNLWDKWADGEPDFKRIKVSTRGTNKEEMSTDDLMPATILARTRKKAAVRGRKVLALAGTRGYGSYRLGDKDRLLLRAVFEDSLPDLWRAYLAT